jgi:hypothetical protein
MKKHIITAMAVVCLTLLSHGAQKVSAAELVTNGSFETGNFTGWTTVNGVNPWRNWAANGANAGGGYTPPVGTTPQDGSFDAWNGVAQNTGGAFTMTQDIALPSNQIPTLKWKDRYQMNLTEFCGPGSQSPSITCGTATYSVQILNTSNVVLQTIYSVTTAGSSNTDTGWVTHSIVLNSFVGQTVRLRFMDSVTSSWAGPGQVEIDAVSLTTIAPTAAYVPVGGQVTNSIGVGLSGATVTITDGSGNSQTTTTGSLGYYNFDEVEVGQTYILDVQKRRYAFINDPRTVIVNDAITDANFQASP